MCSGRHDQCYNLEAWHGTYVDFDEFKKGDIGFHFAKDREVAINRIEDTYCDAERMDYPDGRLIHVALSLHNPLVLNHDLDNWDAKHIIAEAVYKLTKTPYESPQAIYLKEQKRVAQDAWTLLKAAGFDKDMVLEWHRYLTSPQGAQKNLLYTESLRKRFISTSYDGIIYQNDYEATIHQDPTCYIVFYPRQVKVLDPNYPKFTK